MIEFEYVDLFAGAGGTTTGIENACVDGRSVARVIAAVNHDPIAIESHNANHEAVMHFIEDIRTLDVNKLPHYSPGAVKCLWASLECFVAGTWILTKRGLVDIKEITTDDYVLTHKGRWRRVLSTMVSEAETVRVKGQGFPFMETTLGHPFYVKNRKRIWDNPIRRWKLEFNAPHWQPIEELDSQDFVASPINFEHIEIPEVGGRGFEFTDEFFWFIGRWLGDGSISNRGDNQQINICCGKHEEKELEGKLTHFFPAGNKCGKSEIRFYKRECRTAILFDAFHDGLATWILTNFGKGACGKKIPSWAFTMKKSWRENLVKGYLSADGYSTEEYHSISTVSERLSISLKLLLQSLGNSVNVTKSAARGNQIEGRDVNDKPFYIIMWYRNATKCYTHKDGDHIWSKLKKFVETGEIKTVYNLHVEEDESYVANGIVVHNCTQFSNAKGGQSREADSRTLAEHLYRYIEYLDPDIVQIENVREFMTWGPLIQKKHKITGELLFDRKGEPIMYPDPKFKGSDYLNWINHIASYGYNYAWKLLNSADYGAFTSRLRYFGMFAKPGVPIVFPTPTHSKTGKDGLLRWNAVREKLDLQDEGESIFARVANGKKPLVPKTMDRLAYGIDKYVLGGRGKFLMSYYGSGHNVQSIDYPCNTVTTKDRFALIDVEKNTDDQFLLEFYGRDNAVQGLDDPCHAVTTGNMKALVSVDTQFVTSHIHNRVSAVSSLEDPATTILGHDPKYLITTELDNQFIHKQYCGANNVSSVEEPLGAITTNPKHSLITVLYEAGVIKDIKMRMLKVMELKEITGFGADYILRGSQTDQKKFIGNAVNPEVVAAWLEAIHNAITIQLTTVGIIPTMAA